jgi:murein L,D-transpeptidase YcbB/YkuD
MCTGELGVSTSWSRPAGRWILLLTASAVLSGPDLKALADPPISPPAPLTEPAALRPADVTLMRQALDQADAQGLDARSLATPGLDALLGSGDPDKRRRGEAELKGAVLRYARQVHAGRLSASDFDDDWALRPAPFDPAPGLEAALAQNSLAAWLASLPPQHPGYRMAMQQLAAYRDLAAKGGWDEIPAGRKLEPGAKDRRVAALRTRLAVEDPSAPADGPSVLDPSLVEALKTFQRRHGLDEDGTLGPATLAAMNVPVEQRIAQIEANLERWRWLPVTLPADRVEVNVAGAEAFLVKGGLAALTMKAAPGRKTDRTPMLQSTIEALVLNPPWNIPKSIAAKEIWPKEHAHPGYMRAEQIRSVATADGGRRLQQRAGPKSALGQIKFEFDNRFGVYLHDTPTKSAFDKSVRTVSHGCVRLEKPKELADALVQGQAEWSPETLATAIDTHHTQRVSLDRPIPVFLVYRTAEVGPDGRMIFYPDPYDWDQALLQKIEDKRPGRPVIASGPGPG